MSASNIAYHLRSHKAVDRRLFVDLLTRYERWNPLSNAVYLSMGAYPLEDHRLVHRSIGITKLIAFDLDPEVVSRQLFNRPVETCKCVVKSSGEVVDGLNALISESGFSGAETVVIWLDYTDPKLIGQQIREFQTLLDKLAPGDFVRVTVNANPKELDSEKQEDGPVLVTKTMQNHFKQLKEWIGEYLPSDADASQMTSEGFSKLLAQAFGNAAFKALPASQGTTFSPISLVRYADTTQMLSISGALVKRSDETRMRAALGLETWPFASSNWSDVRQLIVPVLTLRERLFLERGIVEKTDDELIDALGFAAAGEVLMADFLPNFKQYYRFYPTMLPAEV